MRLLHELLHKLLHEIIHKHKKHKKERLSQNCEL
jgi:hypothetical protein